MKDAHNYTLAFKGDLLVACFPDGGNLQTELDHEYNNGGLKLDKSEVVAIDNITLTNDISSNGDLIYSGNDGGWITDTDGNVYQYAVAK